MVCVSVSYIPRFRRVFCPVVFQPAMTNTGGRAAVSSASVRMGPSATPSRGRVSVLQATSDATARTRVRQGPSARAACRGASVGREGPATGQPESVRAGTDSLGLCKFQKKSLKKKKLRKFY